MVGRTCAGYQVKAALTKNFLGLPVYAWVAGVLALGVGVVYFMRSGSSATADNTPQDIPMDNNQPLPYPTGDSGGDPWGPPDRVLPPTDPHRRLPPVTAPAAQAISDAPVVTHSQTIATAVQGNARTTHNTKTPEKVIGHMQKQAEAHNTKTPELRPPPGAVAHNTKAPEKKQSYGGSSSGGGKIQHL